MPKLEKVHNYLNQKMFWNNWIITVFESYLNVSLCSMVLIKYSFEFESYGQRFQTIVGIIFLIIYIAIPIIAIVGFLNRFKEVRTRSMKSQFGAFYAKLAVKRGPKVFVQPY